jgi:hypothetical protein
MSINRFNRDFRNLAQNPYKVPNPSARRALERGIRGRLDASRCMCGQRNIRVSTDSSCSIIGDSIGGALNRKPCALQRHSISIQEGDRDKGADDWMNSCCEHSGDATNASFAPTFRAAGPLHLDGTRSSMDSMKTNYRGAGVIKNPRPIEFALPMIDCKSWGQKTRRG